MNRKALKELLFFDSHYKPMGLYPGGLKCGINFAYIRVGPYPGGPLFVIYGIMLLY